MFGEGSPENKAISPSETGQNSLNQTGFVTFAAHATEGQSGFIGRPHEPASRKFCAAVELLAGLFALFDRAQHQIAAALRTDGCAAVPLLEGRQVLPLGFPRG